MSTTPSFNPLDRSIDRGLTPTSEHGHGPKIGSSHHRLACARERRPAEEKRSERGEVAAGGDGNDDDHPKKFSTHKFDPPLYLAGRPRCGLWASRPLSCPAMAPPAAVEKMSQTARERLLSLSRTPSLPSRLPRRRHRGQDRTPGCWRRSPARFGSWINAGGCGAGRPGHAPVPARAAPRSMPSVDACGHVQMDIDRIDDPSSVAGPVYSDLNRARCDRPPRAHDSDARPHT